MLYIDAVNDEPSGQGSGKAQFSTSKNTVLAFTPAMLAALFTDPDGEPLSSIDVTGQPEDSKGSVTPLEGSGGGLQFVPRYQATGESVFQVTAKDATGASSSIPIKVTVLGECCEWGVEGFNLRSHGAEETGCLHQCLHELPCQQLTHPLPATSFPACARL
jgi:hypothetical protein